MYVAGTGAPDAGPSSARGLVMGDVTDEDSAGTAADTHANACPRCRTPTTVAEYNGPGGRGRLVCCLTCGRVLSAETHAAVTSSQPAWKWNSTAPAESRARAGGQPA